MSDLLARLIEAGTPANLVAEVARELARAEVAQEAIEARRSADRERQNRRRNNVMSRDTADVTDAPLSRPPNEINSNPPTHTHENITPRTRKAETFPCPDGVDQSDWDGLKANRKAKRAALSEGAHRQIITKLNRWAEAGWPPGPIVAAAAERGWTTVFETDEMKGAQNGNNRQSGTKRHQGRDGFINALREVADNETRYPFAGNG